jgi:hypothetical protein
VLIAFEQGSVVNLAHVCMKRGYESFDFALTTLSKQEKRSRSQGITHKISWAEEAEKKKQL